MPVLTFDGNAPESVFAFLDETVSARGREHWCWKYRVGASQPPSAFYWQESNGSVLGFIGLMRTNLHARGKRQPAAWFVDWHVRPGVHGVGVGIGLLRKAEAAAGMLLTLQGSADTQKILPPLGWKQSLSPSTWLLPLSARFLSAGIEQRTGRWLRGAARTLGAAASPFLRWRRTAPPAGVELIDVDRFAAEHDGVWRQRADELAPAMSRDSTYMNHLCADFPDGGYRLQLLRLRGESIGHLISRVDVDRRGYHRGRIVDALWPASDSRLASWLVRSACWQLQEAGADYAECVASTAPLRAALRASHFRSRRPVPIWYHRLAEGVPDPDTWHITFLDCDRAYR